MVSEIDEFSVVCCSALMPTGLLFSGRVWIERRDLNMQWIFLVRTCPHECQRLRFFVDIGLMLTQVSWRWKWSLCLDYIGFDRILQLKPQKSLRNLSRLLTNTHRRVEINSRNIKWRSRAFFFGLWTSPDEIQHCLDRSSLQTEKQSEQRILSLVVRRTCCNAVFKTFFPTVGAGNFFSASNKRLMCLAVDIYVMPCYSATGTPEAAYRAKTITASLWETQRQRKVFLQTAWVPLIQMHVTWKVRRIT